MTHTERASSTGELVILVPVLMALVLFVVFVGRLTDTAIGLQHVAEVAAREASMSSRSTARTTAMSSSRRELLHSEIHCERVAVTTSEVAIGDLQSIKVSLACSVSRKDSGTLFLFPITLRTSALSVIDRYRGD